MTETKANPSVSPVVTGLAFHPIDIRKLAKQEKW